MTPDSASLLFAPATNDAAPNHSAPVNTAPIHAAPIHAAPSPWEAVLDRLRDATYGEFEIGRELGRGGMAAVFLARDLALNRRVAIKVMAPGIMMGEGMIERFRQEAITIANLSHPHIVSIYAVRQLDELHFFVMQFIAGQSLESVLRVHGRLSVAVVQAILFQVGSALAYAHRRGVVHRDIKPGNILLSADGDALVTDFGIAKVAEGPTQTHTGMVVGTPTYMSPEQCYAHATDGRSDQYSLGIVAYQLLAGVTPFVGSAFEIMRGHTTQTPPPLSAYRADLPPEMDAAIARMLEKAPADRFDTLGAALTAMGATPVPEGDARRDELIRLAAVEERRTMLGDLLQTPSPSSIPGSASGGRATGATGARTPRPGAGASATNTALAIAPITATLEPGDSLALHARVVGDDATAIRWSVDTPACGSVDPVTGELTALAPGQGHVLATVGSVTERTPFVVAPPRVASVRLEAPVEVLHVGDVTQAHAYALDKRERRLERPMQWHAMGRSVQLAHSGSTNCTVECVAEGASVVTVTCEGVSTSAALHVSAARTTGTHASGASPVGASPVGTSTVGTSPVDTSTVGAPPVGASAVGASAVGPSVVGASAAGATALGEVVGPSTHASSPSHASLPSRASGPSQASSSSPPSPPLTPPKRPAWLYAVAATVVLTAAAAGAVAKFGGLRAGGDATEERGATSAAMPPGTTANPAQGDITPPVEPTPAIGDRVGAETDPPTGSMPPAPAALTGAASSGSTSGSTSGAASGAPSTERPVRAPTDAPTQAPVPAPRPVAENPSAAQREEQARLAREARDMVESFAAAVETRQLSRVRAVYPGLSSGNVETFENMFRSTTAVRMRIGEIQVLNGALYNPSPGSRTYLTAEVTFELIPLGGGTIPPTRDVLPVTLQRGASGWRLEQIGVP